MPGSQLIVLFFTVACSCLVNLGAVGAAEGSEGPEPQTIFRYRTRSGRMAYVNGLERVPKRLRGKALPVDLSHVSLNEQLSADLQRAVDEQLETLRSGPGCESLRRLAGRSWWRLAWERHAHLVLLGALLLLFLGLSPYLVRSIGPARWVKMTMVLLPVCALIGIAGTVAGRTSEALRAFRESADPCRGEEAATDRDTPALRVRRVHALQQLQRQLGTAHALRAQQIEQALEQTALPGNAQPE